MTWEAPDSDAELLGRIRNDPDAVELFYRRHVGRVTGFAVRRCRRPEDVADLVAEVFLRVIEGSATYDSQRGEAVPWLLGVASHCLAARQRSEARGYNAVRRLAGRRLLEPDDYAELEARIDRSRLAPWLQAALEALADRDRQLFDLVHVEELTTDVAARALGLKPAAARMRLTRIRRRLRRLVSRESIGAPVSARTVLVTAQGDRR